MASLRNFYDQFSNSTTLDGSRLERLLRDIVSRFNALQPKDITKRYVETRYLLGYRPSYPALTSQDRLPWMGVANWNNAVELTGAAPEDGFQNPWRHKGTNLPLIVPDEAATDDNQYSWTTALYFSQPVVLNNIYLGLTQSAGFSGTLVYGAAPPPGYATGDSLNDMFLLVHVDDPFVRENRDLNQVAVYKGKFKLTGWSARNVTTDQPTVDMTPALGLFAPATTPLGGAYVELRNLNVPIPESSRVRFSVVIPRYPVAYDTGWFQNPWARSIFSGAIDVLESVA